MKIFLSVILLFLTVTCFGTTPQEPDILIYEGDTVFLNFFPLEDLAKVDKAIRNKLQDKNCIATDCWRQYQATWTIDGNVLYLVALKDCCGLNVIPLDNVFDKSMLNRGMVKADWFSKKFKTGYGKEIGFSEDKWTALYEKSIEIEIEKGNVTAVKVRGE